MKHQTNGVYSGLTNEKGEQSPGKGRGAAGAPRASTAHHISPGHTLALDTLTLRKVRNLTDSTPVPEQRRVRQVSRRTRGPSRGPAPPPRRPLSRNGTKNHPRLLYYMHFRTYHKHISNNKMKCVLTCSVIILFVCTLFVRAPKVFSFGANMHRHQRSLIVRAGAYLVRSE